MPSPAEIELVAERALNPLPCHTVDGWRCHLSSAPFRRANCVVPPRQVHAATVAPTMERIHAWYASKGQRTIVQVFDQPEVDAPLAGAGYEVDVRAVVMLAPIDRPAGPIGAPSDVVVRDPGDAVVSSTGGGAVAARLAGYADVLAERGLIALATHDGTVAGHGLTLVEGDLAGIFGMWTDPARRRTGVGRRILGALLAAAAADGASTAYLQVEDGNEPALALYRSFGFVESHRYHYRTSPAG